jgi:competence ComEA-like helix-hairpin-helix protein
MTGAESRAMRRAAGLLLVASLVRLIYEGRPVQPVVPPGSEDVLPELLAESESLHVEAERRALPLGEGETIDPNRASDIELDRLPGVGPSTALAIVEERQQGTVFRQARDLLNVRGVGEATLARIAPHLDLAKPPPALGTAALGDIAPRVDVNRATAAALQTLPGVGPTLSERIIEKRKENGGFGSVEELLEVQGIGEATLERLRSRVTTGR